MADELVLGLTALNQGYKKAKVMAVSGKDGAATNINDPVDSGYAVAATVEDPVLHSFIAGDGDLRVLLAKIATSEPAPSTCTYTLLKPSNMNIENWSNAEAEDIVLQYSGTNVATNPHGLAQVGDKLYIVDYDSQKIVILGNSELQNTAVSHPVTPPFDLGPNGEGELPPSARGQAIIALKNKAGASFLFALYLNYTSTGDPDSGILVRLTVGSGGVLAYNAKVTVGINAQEIWPIVKGTEDADVLLLVPALGGTQKNGASNGTASRISAVPAFGTWPSSGTATPIVTGDPPASPSTTYAGPTPSFDIRVVVSSLRATGTAPVYILAADFTEDWRGADYRLYKTTVADLFALYTNAPATPPTISSLAVPTTGCLTVVKGGQVYSAAEPTMPFGIFYLALLFQTSADEENERLYEFLGSALTISSAKRYGARAITFGLGTDPGQVGGDNVNSAILLAETIRQYEEEHSLKNNATSIKIAAVSGEEEEEEEEK
ncbi:MAG: hypothetical protein LBG14_05230 [Treponema sp.]|jgi:hypothetical protein|nr:hypothetical protein [Treponema sp.]